VRSDIFSERIDAQILEFGIAHCTPGWESGVCFWSFEQKRKRGVSSFTKSENAAPTKGNARGSPEPLENAVE
jgi:hypothetical protein